MIPSRQAGDILSGMWLLISAARAGAQDAGLGPGVRDRRHRAGQRRGGGVRRDPGHQDPAGPAAGSGVQGDGRAQQRVLRDLVPARPRTSPHRADFNTQLADWLTDRANTRTVRSIQGRPVDLLEADRQAMTPLPPVDPPVGLTHRIRLARDYYVRVDANDYSVDPRVIGRFVDVTASPTRVEAFCDGEFVARHDRSWASHGVITDPAHVATAHQMRLALAEQRRAQQRAQQTGARQHSDGHPVALRALPDYDALFGVDFDPTPTGPTTTPTAAAAAEASNP